MIINSQALCMNNELFLRSQAGKTWNASLRLVRNNAIAPRGRPFSAEGPLYYDAASNCLHAPPNKDSCHGEEKFRQKTLTHVIQPLEFALDGHIQDHPMDLIWMFLRILVWHMIHEQPRSPQNLPCCFMIFQVGTKRRDECPDHLSTHGSRKLGRGRGVERWARLRVQPW
jgi:hypothetical protein